MAERVNHFAPSIEGARACVEAMHAALWSSVSDVLATAPESESTTSTPSPAVEAVASTSFLDFGAYFDLTLVPPADEAVPADAKAAAITRLRQRVSLLAGRPPVAAPPRVTNFSTDHYSADELARMSRWWDIEPAKRFNPFEATGQTICKLAYQQGTPWRHVGRGVVRLGWGARSRLLYRSAIELDSAIGAQISGSKRQTVLLLKSAGMPAPEHELVNGVEAALDAARELGWPVVIKPENAARAEGVTIDISSEEALRQAFAAARELSEDVLVERQVPGLCHRVTVAGDKVIYAVKRIAKGVTGDGGSTVGELVAEANAKLLALPPWQRLKLFPLDGLALEYLARQGLTEQSVPAEGQFVTLRPHSTNEWGGDIENVTDAVHPDNARLAMDAVRLFGLTIGGVDLMTTDISRPWHENGAVIIELNYMPQINLLRREAEAAALVPALLGSDGRIPVHLVTGEGDLLTGARALKAKLQEHGRACHLTTAGHSEDELGQEVIMPLATLFDRGIALLMRRNVKELIIAGSPRELYEAGAVVDRFATVHVVGDDEQAAGRTAREIGRRFSAGSFHRMPSRQRPE